MKNNYYLLRKFLTAFMICVALMLQAQNSYPSENNTSLLLVSPADKEVIETLTPVLNWVALLKLPKNSGDDGMVSNIFYKLIIVKLNEGQEAVPGVASNVPIFTSTNIALQQLVYPTTATPLIEGGRYGWQIQEYANGKIISYSEAWEFKIKEKEKEALNYELNETNIICNIILQEGKCNFLFNRHFTKEEIKIEIRDEKNNTINDFTFTDKFGDTSKNPNDNRYSLTLPGSSAGKRYSIYIYLNNGKKYSIHASNQ